MIELYRTENRDVRKKIEILLARKLSAPFKILRTANGKPYVEGDPLYFSLSHSRDRAVIAICDRPVGVDLEFYDEQRKFSHILSRFTERERREIGSSAAYFYANWTAKEAFIKMRGGTLAEDLKRLEFYGGAVRFGGQNYDVAVTSYSRAGVYAVCAEDYTSDRLADVPLKLFRLKKGEYI